MRVYGYLRASTEEQDAERAKAELLDFAKEQSLTIAEWYIENESGATLKRPELFQLLKAAQQGDVLLVEQIDRISRLDSQDWNTLKTTIQRKGIKIVSLDLPTSHHFIQSSDAFTGRMLQAINDLLLDVLAAVARKDYEDRRRRQAQGVQRAKAENKYQGRPEDTQLHDNIRELLLDGKSFSKIQSILGCSRATIAKVSKRLKHDEKEST